MKFRRRRKIDVLCYYVYQNIRLEITEKFSDSNHYYI